MSARKNYKTVMIDSNMAMSTPSVRHAFKNNIYVVETLIPWDHNTATIVFFVSGTNGDEYGQFPTLEEAIKKLDEATQ